MATLNWRDIVVTNPDTGEDELVRTFVQIDPETGEPGGAGGGDASAANQTTIIGHLDGVETTLTAIDGRVDGLEALATRPTLTSRVLSAAANTNATVAKASAGTLFSVGGYVARASAVYLKIYNKATTPDETDTPKYTEYLPPLTRFQIDYVRGSAFGAGISYRMVTGGADNDTGALTAGDVLAFNMGYA
jgi:hypothetical protein